MPVISGRLPPPAFRVLDLLAARGSQILMRPTERELKE